jgi:hypothetical protein
MLVALGRAIPPAKWVDHLVHEANEASLEAIF